MNRPANSSYRLTMSDKLSYAVGNVGLQMLTAGISFFLMIFYTDVALVPPAIAGAALLVGKIWDTVNDPLFGWLSDRVRSRHGRRRVFLIYGAAPLALLSAAVWLMPPGLGPVAAFLWIAVSYTLYDTVVTAVQLPYASLAAEITHEYDERTGLVAVASFGALAGYLLGSVLMPVLVRAAADARAGYALAGAAFGLIAGASIAWVAWRVREPALEPAGDTADPPWRMVRSALRNRPFLVLVIATGLVRFGFTLVQGGLAYYVIYHLLGDKGDLPRLMAILLGVVGISMFAWKRVVDRWEKNYAYLTGLACTAAGLFALYWLEPGQKGAMMAILVVIGIGMGAHWVVPFSMIPDTVDHGRMQTGERQTGMYMGLYGLIDKLARALATAATAFILESSGYVPNVAQTAEALSGIRLSVALLPGACVMAAIPLLLFYPITRAHHAAIVRHFDSPGPS